MNFAYQWVTILIAQRKNHYETIFFFVLSGLRTKDEKKSLLNPYQTADNQNMSYPIKLFYKS